MTRKFSIAMLKEAAQRERDDENGDNYDRRDPDAGLPPPRTTTRQSASAPTIEPPMPVYVAAVPNAVLKAASRERVHTSIYLPREAWRRLRAIAAAEDCKVHDLLTEAVVDLINKRAGDNTFDGTE
jgi:hypothetical protein